ncbi:MAG: hypothetical protein V2I48_01890, partial [Xanthomonadales bacterium]|nr:hypothetical protein [Xanthomonadales bacterium]
PTNQDLTIAGAANPFIFRPNGFGFINNADFGLTVCHEGGTDCRVVNVRPSGIVTVTKSS